MGTQNTMGTQGMRFNRLQYRSHFFNFREDSAFKISMVDLFPFEKELPKFDLIVEELNFK